MKDNIKFFILSIYTLSGIVALSYEILWLRMLTVVFGISLYGVVVTVSALLAGLGIGSLIGYKFRQRIKHPLLIFALLELCVAVFCLMLPHLIMSYSDLISNLSNTGGVYVWLFFQSLSMFLFLLLPSIVMGFGLPIILEASREHDLKLSSIYGFNTVGASIGALIPLYLLPNYGWDNSLRLMAMIGVFIGLGSILLWIKLLRTETNVKLPDFNDYIISRVDLLAYCGIGFTALIIEICWIRLYGMLFLRTEYVAGIILTSFLLGIGIGSLLSKHLSKNYLSYFPYIGSLFILLSLFATPYLSQLVNGFNLNTLPGTLFIKGLAISLLTFPVTLIMGIWLPMIVKYLKKEDMSGSVLYGINSVGAAVGSIIAGFFLIPLLGTYGTIVISSFLLFFFGVYWSEKKYWLFSIVLLVVAIPLWKMPGVNELLPASFPDSRNIFFHEDAISTTHVVEKEDGQYVLLSDLQRMDASSDPASVELQKNQARLSLLLHEKPESVLFLGLGTGISAAGSLPFSLVERHAVELSEGSILSAIKYFNRINRNVMDHLEISRDDARNYLKNTSKKYDVIIGDVFHPDLVGRASMLSSEQFARTKHTLKKNGIFVQWVALNQFDIESLETVLRTFSSVFTRNYGFMDGFRLALVGVNGNQDILKNLYRETSENGKEKLEEYTGGEGILTWMARYWGPLFRDNGIIQGEWDPHIEFDLPMAKYRNEIDIAKMLAWILENRVSVGDPVRIFGLRDIDSERVKNAFTANNLIIASWIANIRGEVGKAVKLARIAYDANPKDRWIGNTLSDFMYESIDEAIRNGMSKKETLTRILNIRQDHPGALEDLWLLEEKDGNAVQAVEYFTRLSQISPLNINVRKRITY